MTANDLIAAGYRMGGVLIHRMTDDLTPADFYHVPVPGSNTAAWIVGHLALTFRRTAERMGATDQPPVPAEMATRFAVTGKAADAQTGLGDPADLTTLFDACLAAVIAATKNLPASKLDEPATSAFATSFGESVLFGAMHIAVHSGQLSTIRRSLGKPPVV